MTIQANEQMSGGFVRDADDRLVVVVGQFNGGAGTNSAGVPSGATPVSSSSGNVANANAVATLAAAAAKFTYISGFQLTAAGATAAGVVSATVAGVQGGTLTYTFTVPAGATLGATPLIVEFPEPIPSSAVNTAIVVTLPALGAGNTNAAASAQGFQL